jgi:hypothetical protein
MNEPDLGCFDCIASASGEHHGFAANCKICTARAFARGPLFFAARNAMRGTAEGEQARAAYRDALERLGVTHEQVRAAAANDAAMLIAAERRPVHGGYPETVTT